MDIPPLGVCQCYRGCGLSNAVPHVEAMAALRLRIDISGTVGYEAWETIRQFEMIQNAQFGPEYGLGGPCRHSPEEVHPQGE